MSLNRVMLLGRLTRDPEMRYTPSGQPVTSFGMATNHFQGSGEDRKEVPDYHECVAWNIGNRNLAEIMGQNLKKGQLVYVEGRLQTRSWEGQDGQKRKTTEIIVNDFEFLESRRDQDREQPQSQSVREHAQEVRRQAVESVNPDDIPF